MTASGVEPRHADAVALFHNGDSRSDSGDQADRFMAGNERKGRLERPIAVSRVEIGVANAARFRLHHDLSNSRCGDVPLAKHKRLSEVLDHCCFIFFAAMTFLFSSCEFVVAGRRSIGSRRTESSDGLDHLHQHGLSVAVNHVAVLGIERALTMPA